MITSHHKASQNIFYNTHTSSISHFHFSHMLSHITIWHSPITKSPKFCSIKKQIIVFQYVLMKSHISWFFSSIIFIQSMAYTILRYRSLLTANIHETIRHTHNSFFFCFTTSAKMTHNLRNTHQIWLPQAQWWSRLYVNTNFWTSTQKMELRINHYAPAHDSKYTTLQFDFIFF